MATDIPYPGERQAVAIQEAKKLVYEAQRHAQESKDALRDLEQRLHTIIATDDTPELQKLVDRIQEHHRKYNEMELGSFMIWVNRALEEAWGRLP